jgi:hypothetical protein
MAEELWDLLPPGQADRGTFERFARHIPEEWIEEALEASGTATVRRRRLPADRVVWLTIGIALFRDLPVDAVVRHLEIALPDRRGKHPARSGVTQARQRLGASPLQHLFARTGQVWSHRSASELSWRGHPVFGMDGTTARVPDSAENRTHFGGRRGGRGESGYPAAHIVTLTALRSHVLANARIGPMDTSELALAEDLWKSAPENALVIVDRLFLVAPLLLPIEKSGRHWLTRARKNTAYRVVKRLAPGDYLVEMEVRHAARKQDPSLPRTWLMRAIRYKRRGFRPQLLLTSLLDPVAYPRDEVLELYHERWEMELGYDEVKTEMLEREEAVRSQSPAGVEQELWGLFIAYNLVRLEMEAVARVAKVPPTRVSFVAGLRFVRDTLRLAALVSPGKLASFLERSTADLTHFILPPRRRERRYPRAVKLKMSHYARNRRRPKPNRRLAK